MHAKFIYDIRILEEETYIVPMTVVGDGLDSEDDPSIPTVSLLDIKIMLDNIISDAHKGFWFCTTYIIVFTYITQYSNSFTWKFPSSISLQRSWTSTISTV